MIKEIEVYIFSCHKRHQISLEKLVVAKEYGASLCRAIEEVFGYTDMIGIPLISYSGKAYTAIVSSRRKKPYNLLFLFKNGSSADVPFLAFDESDSEITEYVAKEMMDGRIVKKSEKNF